MGMVDIPGMALDPEEDETRAIHELIDFTDKDVLEIGCGDGRLTRRFASQTHSVLGLDLDAESIALANALTPEATYPGVTYEVGDIATTPPLTGAFDVAILSWSL